MRADFTIKFGDQYYTDTGWSGSAGTKSVVLGQYYKFYGFESISEVSVQVPELVDDEVGLDVTLNVVVVGIGGSDQTGSLGTHNVLFILRVYPGRWHTRHRRQRDLCQRDHARQPSDA